jgi:hypothetical protein
MAETVLLRAEGHRRLITKVNIAKKLDTAGKGIAADLGTRKKDILQEVRELFEAGVYHASEPHVVSNYKLESTRMAKAEGVDVEIPDGIVQCQIRVSRRELTATELETARGCGAVAAGLTEIRRVVQAMDIDQVLLHLATNRAKVATLVACGTTGFSLDLAGGPVTMELIPGMTMRDAWYPADGFLDKVQELAPEVRTACMPFIRAVLGSMVDPVLVFGNRSTTTPTAGATTPA